MTTNVTSESKKPTKPMFSQVGRHAEDAMKSVAASMELSLDEVQKGIITNTSLQPKLQQFLREMAEEYRLATQPHLLKRKPFDPKKFLGEKWSVAEEIGLRVGDILDASKIVLKHYLQGKETSINGEKRLERIKATPADVQLDASDFLALWEEEGHMTLKWLYETQKITWMSFWGTILVNPGGDRRVLCLCRREDGSWDWGYDWLDHGNWSADYPSASLAS